MMTKECFEQLLQQHQASGMGIKKFLQERGICYSNYQYWKHKFSQSSESEPASGILTPVNVSQTATLASPAPTDGINMLFPNGVRVFCSANMEEAAIRLINQYTGSHVLPE